MAKTTVNSGFFSGGVHFQTPIDGSVNHGHTLRLAPEVKDPEVINEFETVEEIEAAEETPAAETPRKRIRTRK